MQQKRKLEIKNLMFKIQQTRQEKINYDNQNQESNIQNFKNYAR